MTDRDFAASRLLSPRRRTTAAADVEALADEQLAHFGIDPESDYGRALRAAALNLYRAQADVTRLWEITLETIDGLDPKDRVALFNAKKFLSFQMAKVLDTFQNPFRRVYQALGYSGASLTSKGPYPIFDNVTALFAANPVIVRSATYIYACTEWVTDAFEGKELLLEIYSRLLNPTSISLANFIVDVECGPYAPDYMAWNFNSGMAAIDALLSLEVKRGEVVIASRNVYGGTWQLLHDWFAREDKLGIHLEWFDGHSGEEFAAFLADVEERHAAVLARQSEILVFLESPCNPHGYVLDVPAICRAAHAKGHTVALDSTIATPFLQRPLQRPDSAERPDYLIHSYTKDLTGNGNATAGVVIGENHRMFIPKGESFRGVNWDETMFWGVYYVKGAFLDADKAFEVISGMKTLEVRMLKKCINTLILSRFLDSHPALRVHCNALDDDPNRELRERVLRDGLVAPLFTIDFERAGLSRDAFVRFFDALDPAFHHQVSLGESKTLALCPALTSHSELDDEALAEAGIALTTIRIAVGDEHAKELIAHFVHAARLAIDPELPGFSDGFMGPEEVDALVRDTYLTVHERYVDGFAPMAELLGAAEPAAV
ncbi:MAG: PLP-dependent transferase [Gemmatimonadota bacterium]|nr:PLP-dependent transferase [Gemmatimonadota bacterium]